MRCADSVLQPEEQPQGGFSLRLVSVLPWMHGFLDKGEGSQRTTTARLPSSCERRWLEAQPPDQRCGVDDDTGRCSRPRWFSEWITGGDHASQRLDSTRLEDLGEEGIVPSTRAQVHSDIPSTTLPASKLATTVLLVRDGSTRASSRHPRHRQILSPRWIAALVACPRVALSSIDSGQRIYV